MRLKRAESSLGPIKEKIMPEQKKENRKAGRWRKKQRNAERFTLRKFNTIYMMKYISSYLPVKSFEEGPRINK